MLNGWQIFYLTVAINSIILTTFGSIVAAIMALIHFLTVDTDQDKDEGKK